MGHSSDHCAGADFAQHRTGKHGTAKAQRARKSAEVHVAESRTGVKREWQGREVSQVVSSVHGIAWRPWPTAQAGRAGSKKHQISRIASSSRVHRITGPSSGACQRASRSGGGRDMPAALPSAPPPSPQPSSAAAGSMEGGARSSRRWVTRSSQGLGMNSRMAQGSSALPAAGQQGAAGGW